MRETSIRHKVVLRIVVGNNGYLAEISCRGADLRFSGPRGVNAEATARVALAAALGALKAPCSLECFIDEACAGALNDIGELSPFEHFLQPFFLSPMDDPSMRELFHCLRDLKIVSAA